MSEEKQTREYFVNEVNPVFESLIFNLVKRRPEDLLDYCIKFFRNDPSNSQSDDSDHEQLFQTVSDFQFKQWRQKRLQNTTREIRTAICSEVYGPFHKRNVISLRKADPKDETTEMKILFFFMNSFLFSHFNEEEKKILIDNMIGRSVSQGQKVIIQGEYGNQMYFVNDGQFECYQEDKNGTKRVLKLYKSGQFFGQLCILHNSARMTTIQAKTKGFLYCLDRQVYRHIKKLSIVKRRTLYTQAMRKVNIFENFQKDQMQKICDVLTEISYEAGNIVINEGDMGNKFYIVLQGILVAFKGKQQSVIQCFKEGDYFGELALLNQAPRQASVKAVTKCTLVYLTQSVFKRIINRQKIQKEIAQKYKQKRNVMIKKRGE